jgi:hypothetical protein
MTMNLNQVTVPAADVDEHMAGLVAQGLEI